MKRTSAAFLPTTAYPQNGHFPMELGFAKISNENNRVAAYAYAYPNLVSALVNEEVLDDCKPNQSKRRHF